MDLFNNTFLIFISLFLLFICIILFFINVKKTLNLRTKKDQINNLENMYNNVRGFKHDFDNIIQIIGGYIETNDMQGLKTYYSELRNDCNKINNIELLNPYIINNPGIYKLILSKYQKAMNLGIEFNLDIFFDFTSLHTSVYKLSRILGILLDNAIEAASECDIKQVRLSFRESQKNHTQIICVENTYIPNDIDILSIFEKGVSSKEHHSGLGLWNIHRILEKDNNILLRTTAENNLFKQQIEIYY